MNNPFDKIFSFLLANDKGGPFAGIDILSQFNPDDRGSAEIARSLNAAFLIVLAGSSHPDHNEASRFLVSSLALPKWKEHAEFYLCAKDQIAAELHASYANDSTFQVNVDDLAHWLNDEKNLHSRHETIEKIRKIFFPEGVGLCEDLQAKVAALRRKREVSLTEPNPSPITDPGRELLFTSNILLTIPLAKNPVDELTVSSHLKDKLKNIVHEDQIYWYDHPVPIGIAPEHNEILYGLEGLDRAIAFEKERGTLAEDVRVACALSVSVTHRGLQEIAKEYLEDELKREKNIRHIDVYVFTEADTARIIDDVLVPHIRLLPAQIDPASLQEIFGVDGEYGRHYSFLKAVAAFWQVFINPSVKGTFKIDLDQIFPQKELAEQSGLSAFGHFTTPWWGATGTDADGEAVELGMIAGALVNQKDIGTSLFFPDVCFPSSDVRADEIVFFSPLPQALSTEAEMMTRYTGDILDGRKKCIHRIHVTGGTCGILIDSLRKHRPFTPTFIGRAEDQAYILSVLFENNTKLRYLHKDGLIMRHDKEAFAAEAIKIASTGKLVGDYVRTLMFSYYANALPWSFEKIKDTIDPFTGCFVSKIPLTLVYLRFSLKAASFFDDNSENKIEQGFAFMQNGIKRLTEAIQHLTKEPNPLIKQYTREKEAWNMYYDILDRAADGIGNDDTYILELKQRAVSVVASCKISF